MLTSINRLKYNNMKYYVRKMFIKTMKQYVEFEHKSGDGLLIFPKELKQHQIQLLKKEKTGFVCIAARGNSNTYDHYWGETELNAVNNLYKYLLQNKLTQSPIIKN